MAWNSVEPVPNDGDGAQNLVMCTFMNLSSGIVIEYVDRPNLHKRRKISQII